VRRYRAARAVIETQETTMYAVVTTGGKQYRVEAGTELTIERLAADAGSSVTFDRILFVGDGDTVTVGTPTVDGATVSATVLGEELGPKLRIFKFKQKVKYRRTTGHRQHFTRVRIDEISAAGKTEKAKTPEKAEKPAAAKTDAPEATAAKAAAPAPDPEAVTEAPKPKRTRKPAVPNAETAKAEAKADDAEPAAPKPKRTRKPAAPKAKAETEGAPESEE
jgi:large subunit ribosomal protein L21